MPGSSNFLRFNPNEINTIDDNSYSLNGQRLGGLQGGVAPSAMHNKVYLQNSTMVAAIGQVLADLGFTVSDHDFPGLISALSTVFGSTPSAIFPKDYTSGAPPQWLNTDAVLLPTGLSQRTTDNTATLTVASDLTINLSVNGANGLDSGVKSPNTWYYLYIIGKSSDNTVAGLWSTVNESNSGSIILPSGYDLKAQTKTAWRVNGSNVLMYANIAGGWPFQPLMMYNESTSKFNTTTPLTVLSSGTSTSFVSVNCNTLIPPVSSVGYFSMGLHNQGASLGTANIRTTGFAHNGIQFEGNSGNASGIVMDRYSGLYEVDSLQRLDYKVSGAARAGIDVMGYLITEIN